MHIYREIKFGIIIINNIVLSKNIKLLISENKILLFDNL